MFDTVSRSRLSVGASPPVIIDMPIRCIASCTLGYLLPPRLSVRLSRTAIVCCPIRLFRLFGVGWGGALVLEGEA